MARTPTSVNLSEVERAQLKELMRRFGKNQSETIRHLILVAYLTPEVKIENS